MEKLLELLGEALYKQVSEKLGDNFVLIDKPNFIKKERFEEVQNQLKEVKTQLTDRDNQLKELGEKAKGHEELTKKISELEGANKKTVTDYEAKILARERDFAIDTALTSIGAKNSKAVKALIDGEKVVFKDGSLSGLNEQLEALKKSDTYLFNEVTPPTPGKFGGQPTPPNNSSVSEFADFIKMK